MKKLLLFFLLTPFVIWSQTNFEKGEKLYHAKKYDEAKVVFEGVLKTKPSDIKTLEYLGDIEAHHKAWESAARYFKKLKELKPNTADYFYKYGGSLAMQAMEVSRLKALGMVSEMKESFEKAIIIDPKHCRQDGP